MNARMLARGAVTLMLAATLLPAAPARANLCTNVTKLVTADNYQYHRCGVPDIDQVRATWSGIVGLPGDGKNYCVPTATLNSLGYIARHGYPNVAPGPIDYQATGPLDQTGYNYVSLNLTVLGAQMSTDQDKGTQTEDAFAVIVNRLESAYPGYFWTVHVKAKDAQSPHMDTAIAPFALLGGLVMPRVGWYVNLHPFYIRVGGHLVTMMDITRLPGSRTMSIHDPGSNDSEYAQGGPTTETYGVSSVQGIYDGNLRWQDQVVGYAGPATPPRVGSIDGFLAIVPMYGFVTKDTEITIYNPARFTVPEDDGGGDSDEPRRFQLGGRVRDIAYSEATAVEPYLLEGDDVIHSVNIATGERADVARVPGATRLAIGGTDQRLFVLANSPTRVVPTPKGPAVNPSSSLVALDQNGRPIASASTTVPLDAITFDSGADQLVAASSRARVLQRYDRDLKLVRSDPLPVSPCDPTAKMSLSVAPDGAVWTHCDASNIAYRTAVGRSGRLETTPVALQTSATAMVPATGLTVDGRGHLLATVNGKLMEFYPNGSRVTEGSLFAGLPGGEHVRVAHSFTNRLPSEPRRTEDFDS